MQALLNAPLIPYCSNWCLLDPTHEEESNAEGLLSMSINGDGALTLFQHTGLWFQR